MSLYDDKTYIPNPIVTQNEIITRTPVRTPLINYEEVKHQLPHPVWEDHTQELDCYWDCWKKMFDHMFLATEKNQFLYNGINTVFNGNVFMWDTVFSAQYARYGQAIFRVTESLDNFYHRQHPDGFICRELSIETGEDTWSRHDPSGTGPDIFAWGEWQLYKTHGDKKRLEQILPPLLGYFYWMRIYRKHPDGSRWYTGWGSGVDNQVRHPCTDVPFGVSSDESGVFPIECYWFLSGGASWIDATAHALLSCDTLLRMIKETGLYKEHIPTLRSEQEILRHIIHDTMWHDEIGFYVDRHADGKLSQVKSIVAFWVLLTEGVPKERVAIMVDHLKNRDEFARAFGIPTLSADDPTYVPTGGYWRGGVWPPTTYMVLQALHYQGFHALAHTLSLQHLHQVTQVYTKTHTVWENYAADFAQMGDQAKPDMLGWSGLGPIAVLIESVFGFEIDTPSQTIYVRPYLEESYALEHLTLGDTSVSISIGPLLKNGTREGDITCCGNLSFTLIIDCQ